MRELNTFLTENGEYRYRVTVPDFVAGQDYSHWEKDRFASMEANLCAGDVLFDVGAELGWMSAIFATFVRPENVCLFEAAAELWPTIKAVWEANNLAVPKATYCGLISNRTTETDVRAQAWPWPEATNWPALAGFENWFAIHRALFLPGTVPELTLDSFISQTGIIPAAVTMDIEGAEIRALRGASKMLKELRPLVWVSLHPDARLQKYGATKQDVRDLMAAAGYTWQYLGVDHEEHYFFYPKERSVVLVDSPWHTFGKRTVDFETAVPDWRDPLEVEKEVWGQ